MTSPIALTIKPFFNMSRLSVCQLFHKGQNFLLFLCFLLSQGQLLILCLLLLQRRTGATVHPPLAGTTPRDSQPSGVAHIPFTVLTMGLTGASRMAAPGVRPLPASTALQCPRAAGGRRRRERARRVDGRRGAVRASRLSAQRAAVGGARHHGAARGGHDRARGHTRALAAR